MANTSKFFIALMFALMVTFSAANRGYTPPPPTPPLRL